MTNKKPEVNLKNVMSFAEGYSKKFWNRLFPYKQHLQEQFAYRLYMCKDDCMKKRACIYCGCPPEDKKFVKESCNKGERFPNLMGEKEWEEFKKLNNINEENLRD